jgi:hypothetical protein
MFFRILQEPLWLGFKMDPGRKGGRRLEVRCGNAKG